jgi:hypothetical protein
MDRELSIEGDEPSFVALGDFDKIRVVHLLMSQGSLIKCRGVTGWRRPERVLFVSQ